MKTRLMISLSCLCFTYACNSQPAKEQTSTSTEPQLVKSSKTSSVPSNHFARLTKGINLAHLYSQVNDNNFDLSVLAKHTTPQDIDIIKYLGFKHVRLPVTPKFLWDTSGPVVLKEPQLAALRQTIKWITDKDMGVIVDAHPIDDNYTNDRLSWDPAFRPLFVQFWGALASRLSDLPTDKVFFEILNEPFITLHTNQWTIDNHVAGSDYWGLQDSCIKEIRKSCPENTIIANGGWWWGTASIATFAPMHDDQNLVYSFHYYLPGPFCNQGMTGDPNWGNISNLPWPSTPDMPAVQAAMSKISDQMIRDEIATPQNSSNIDRDFKTVSDWAITNDAKVMVTEFGVVRGSAPNDSRGNWLKAVRQISEKYNFGWTVWEYRAGFGVVESIYPDGNLATGNHQVKVFNDVLVALGLNNVPSGIINAY